MLVNFVFVVLLAVQAIASATPMRKRQEARVVTTCSKPNTAALTFVSCFPRLTYRMTDDLFSPGRWPLHLLVRVIISVIKLF